MAMRMMMITDDDDNYVKNDTITYQRNTLLNYLEGEQKEIIIDLMNYTTQKDLAIKYNKSKKAISYHINKLKKIKNG
jgi:predicted transcriptional regulator